MYNRELKCILKTGNFCGKCCLGGTWVAQSVKCSTLGFGSGCALKGQELKPHIGLCADSADPAWDSLSPSLSLFPVHSISLKINKLKIKFKKKRKCCLHGNLNSSILFIDMSFCKIQSRTESSSFLAPKTLTFLPLALSQRHTPEECYGMKPS